MTHQPLIEAVRARRSAPDFGRDQHVRREPDCNGGRRPRIAPVSHAVRKAVQLVRERFQNLVRRLVVRRHDHRGEADGKPDERGG